jgi:hypothetical protein
LFDQVRIWLAYAATILIACFALVVFRHPTLDLTIALLSVAVICAGALPALLLIAQPRETRPPIPLLALSGIFYAMFFGGSVFLLHLVRQPEDGPLFLYVGVQVESVSISALIAVIIGLAGMYSGCAIVIRAMRIKQFPVFRIRDSHHDTWPAWLVCILIVAHLTYLYIPTVRSVPSSGQFLGPIGILGLAYLYVVWRRQRFASVLARIAALVAALLVLGAYFGSAYLTPIAMLFAALLVLEFWLSGKIPWRPALLLLVTGMLVYPLMTPVREHLWNYQRGLGQGERILDAINIAGKSAKIFAFGCDASDMSVDTEEVRICNGLLGGYRGLANRMAHAAVLTHVMAQTPTRVPLWNGETYKPLISSFIPRVVWSGKPEERTGNKFGRRYGFIEGNDQTSVNLPWITELFANFGWLGILFGMTLIGGFIGVLERTLSIPKMNDLEVVVGMSVLLPLFYQESNFSLMTGSIIPYIVCIWVYFTYGSKLLAAIFANKQDNEH